VPLRRRKLVLYYLYCQLKDIFKDKDKVHTLVRSFSSFEII